MSRLHLDEIQAGLEAIAALEESPEYKQRLQQATASDHPDEYVQKIEAMKKSFRDQANQTKYESQQRLASLFREMSHVLTDLVHSMSLVGDDTSAMQKLAGQVVKITKSISFNGENDKDNNLVNDDINLSLQDGESDDEDEDSEDDDDDLDLGEGKSNKRADKAFRNAVQSIKPVDDKTSDKKSEKQQKPAPVEDDDAEDDTEDNDDSEDPTDEKGAKEAPKKSDDKKSKDDKSKKDNKKDGKKTKSGGFVDGLLSEKSEDEESDDGDAEASDEEETEDANYADTVCVAADFGFSPYAVTSAWIRIKGERVQAVKVVSVDDAGTITASYYRPTKKFFSGDSGRVLKAFSRIQERVPGYNTVLEEIHNKTESGHLVLLHTTEVSPEVLSELPGFHAVGGRDSKGLLVVSRAGTTCKYSDKKSKKTERVVKRLLASLPYQESNARIRRFLKKNTKLVLKKSW